MADVKGGPNPLFLREEELRQAMELLFFAYRDFTGEPDKILADYGFGRAHHRVIYFVGRNPGITVSELLAILRITKQSLSRVLSQLVADGFIIQRPGLRDRRQRLLELTDKGRELENKLSEQQRIRKNEDANKDSTLSENLLLSEVAEQLLEDAVFVATGCDQSFSVVVAWNGG